MWINKQQKTFFDWCILKWLWVDDNVYDYDKMTPKRNFIHRNYHLILSLFSRRESIGVGRRAELKEKVNCKFQRGARENNGRFSSSLSFPSTPQPSLEITLVSSSYCHYDFYLHFFTLHKLEPNAIEPDIRKIHYRVETRYQPVAYK